MEERGSVRDPDARFGFRETIDGVSISPAHDIPPSQQKFRHLPTSGPYHWDVEGVVACMFICPRSELANRIPFLIVPAGLEPARRLSTYDTGFTGVSIRPADRPVISASSRSGAVPHWRLESSLGRIHCSMLSSLLAYKICSIYTVTVVYLQWARNDSYTSVVHPKK